MATYNSMGWATAFATRAEATWNTDPGAATERFLIDSGGLQKRAIILERDAVRGHRSSVANDTRTGPYTVGGTINLRPTPEDLAIWLPRIFGAAASGTTFALADELPSFKVTQDIGAKVETFLGCKVDRATFSYRKGDFVRLALDICGATASTGNAGTFPSLTGSITTPFIICDAVLSMLSVVRPFDDLDLIINNNIVKDDFKNSCTVVSLDEGPREVSVRATLPWNATHTDLYNVALAGAANATLTLTLGNYAMTHTFGTLQIPAETPVLGGKDAIPLILDMVARQVTSTKEISTVLDSTG